MTRVARSPIQIILLESLKNFGWQGKWELDEKYITIESTIGLSLEEYVHEKPLDYADGLRLALCLGEQLDKLSEYNEELGEKHGVLFFNIKDILVVEKDIFLLTNLSKVLPITDENHIILEEPLPFNGLLAPELEGVDTLPLVVNPTCAYYSLALLCLKALELDFEGGLERLAGSKFFYLLQRCLENDPKKRHLIYV
tara:strand:- start:15050 stop:15640 length:591 start_codon:yes stop_codon:yes gene_type:complete